MPVDHLIIPDTQIKEGAPIRHLSWIGRYICQKQPEVIIHLGDHFDMPSLSSYDKGTAKMEGLRVDEDITAGVLGMHALLNPIRWMQERQRRAKVAVYQPRMVYLYGNHDERIERYVNANPELIGTMGYKSYSLESMGWECYDFLSPVDIDGILYCHYFANPLTGRPYTANALNQLKTLGRSYVMGHRQVLDFGTRMLVDGQQQIGIIAGACYLHDEGYKGYQGNKHWRGIVVLHDVHEGFGNPMFVDLDYLERKYEKEVEQAGPEEDVYNGTTERGSGSKRLHRKTSVWSVQASPKKGNPRRKKGTGSSGSEGLPPWETGV